MRANMAEKGRLGFRVLTAPPPLDVDLVRRFAAVPSSTVADAMGRFGFMDSGIRKRAGGAVSGHAVTVQCRPGDNLMVHKALQVASPGDVIVVRTGGNTEHADCGELMPHAAPPLRLAAH